MKYFSRFLYVLILFFSPKSTLVTGDDDITTVLPDSGTDLENVEFQDTTTYHWGKFDVNATDNNGFEDAQGPFAFGLATKLNKEKNQVLSHCLEIMKKVSFFMQKKSFCVVLNYLNFHAKNG